MAYPNPPKTWSAGDVVTAAQLNAELRDALNIIIPTASTTLAYSTYTPTLAQGATGNIAKTALGRYTQIGKMVTGNVSMSVSGTGTGSANVTVSLPVTMSSAYGANDIFGEGFIYDNSASTKYRALLAYNSTTTVLFLTLHSTTNGNLGTTDFTAALAANDNVTMHFTYEAA